MAEQTACKSADERVLLMASLKVEKKVILSVQQMASWSDCRLDRMTAYE